MYAHFLLKCRHALLILLLAPRIGAVWLPKAVRMEVREIRSKPTPGWPCDVTRLLPWVRATPPSCGKPRGKVRGHALGCHI